MDREGWNVKELSPVRDAGTYDGQIASVLPYYREYHGQIIDLVRTLKGDGADWLDSGCGTGTLALRALEELEGMRFTLCDPSEKMLNIAREKLAGKNIRFMNLAAQSMAFDGEFDVVTAVQSHHYLSPAEREGAVKNCFRALRKGGVFIVFEHIRMTAQESEAAALKRWGRYLLANGHTNAEVRAQFARRGTEVFPITAEEHLKLMRKCGFSSADMLWFSYLQAGFWAIR